MPQPREPARCYTLGAWRAPNLALDRHSPARMQGPAAFRARRQSVRGLPKRPRDPPLKASQQHAGVQGLRRIQHGAVHGGLPARVRRRLRAQQPAHELPALHAAHAAVGRGAPVGPARAPVGAALHAPVRAARAARRAQVVGRVRVSKNIPKPCVLPVGCAVPVQAANAPMPGRPGMCCRTRPGSRGTCCKQGSVQVAR